MRKIRYPVYLPVQETIDLAASIQSLLGRKTKVVYGKQVLLCTILDIDQISPFPIFDEYVSKASAITLCVVDLDEEQPAKEEEQQKKKGPGRPPRKKEN